MYGTHVQRTHAETSIWPSTTTSEYRGHIAQPVSREQTSSTGDIIKHFGRDPVTTAHCQYQSSTRTPEHARLTAMAEVSARRIQCKCSSRAVDACWMALEHIRDQAGHTSSVSFAAAGQTIVFMQNIHRWFVLHDTSNTTQHIHKKWPDTWQFDDAEYARLEWLEVMLPVCLDELEKSCRSQTEFLTKETYGAFLLTTYSTVACIEYLLKKEEFLFVLTRKFDSDPIELLFGTLRMSSGCNDMLNVRSVLQGLEKVLKTGLAASSMASNVAHRKCAQKSTGKLLTETSPSLAQQPPQLQRATCALQRINATVLPQHLPSLEISATVYVGGYIARVINENMCCGSCTAVYTKPASNQPILQFTPSQDRGGLLYPSDQLTC
ncbi:hypothetical protein HPB51_023955 [Rhipicephalus microplus]|uniref:Uncharacterized protein n=1 Tax=Rhipicephalus microplus TaxID=6941 RepID=A0A9J6EV87_RHIMP|nr:hypothetical protein HPB51_023955 [Rhipicephalus microplus]